MIQSSGLAVMEAFVTYMVCDRLTEPGEKNADRRAGSLESR